MTNLNTQPAAIRRRTIYVDRAIQKWLLIALVTFEIVLVSAALWLLYLQLNAMVEDNLYRIHFSGEANIDPALLRNMLLGLGGLVAINIAVLLMVDWFWTRHINSILQPLIKLLNKVEVLNFSEDEPVEKSHKVVEFAHVWRNNERQRLFKLRTEIAKLDVSGDASAAQAKERKQAALENILKLLP